MTLPNSTVLVDDQIETLPNRSSSWIRAPAPVKFVRRQGKVEIAQGQRGQTENLEPDKVKASEENISNNINFDLSTDKCNSGKQRNAQLIFFGSSKRGTESKYYKAHRLNVAEELKKSEYESSNNYNNADNDTWDGVMRVLSV
jgi:hypothetical protein